MSKKEFGSTWYQIKIWNKTLFVIHYKSSPRLGIDALIFHLPDGHTNDVCLKCNTVLPVKPTHGSEITCQSCESMFKFAGALNPEAICKTRVEVETAINMQFRRMRKDYSGTMIYEQK